VKSELECVMLLSLVEGKYAKVIRGCMVGMKLHILDLIPYFQLESF
jgi:hypothetical protein